MHSSPAAKIVLHTLLCNVFLVLLKFFVGKAAGSAALLAEAVHSMGDILANLAVLVSVHLSGKPPDGRHHFGHGKIESLSSCAMGFAIAFVGLELTRSALVSLRAGEVAVPGTAALYASAAGIIIKEIMFRYTRSASCKTGNQLLLAVAWDHRSDVMVSSSVFLGIAGARAGFPLLEGLVALFISVLIIRLGFTFCRRGFGDLVDTAPDEAVLEKIRAKVQETAGVEAFHCLRARRFGSEIHVELHIGVDENLRVSQGHEVAKEVKKALLGSFPEISHVLVHVNPFSP
ncbi:MAG: cation transporter [Dethiobacter sp.]|nr:cation transporter [Dethiobacter sp.]MCL5982974.1 cation diffusion facilitator family transporter [Bacillota bacterium]